MATFQERDPKFIDALEKIKRCAEIALTQGSGSRCNALREIIELARRADS